MRVSGESGELNATPMLEVYAADHLHGMKV
jgi:hypothetical protein